MIGRFSSAQWGVVIVERGNYVSADGPLAVRLLCENGEPLTALSVNMYRPDCSQDSRDLPPDCFYLKTWGANEDLAAEAFHAGVFVLRPDLPPAFSGFVEAPAAELLAKEEPTP
jgi:hypothetical protein